MARSTGLSIHGLLVIAGLVASVGCRMCPDPFDYSGPVPNGSAPQNDFRARSNGTRPLLAAPRPWPPVVQAEPVADPATPEAEGPAAQSVLVAGGDAAATGDEDAIVPVVNTAVVDASAADAPTDSAGGAAASPRATDAAGASADDAGSAGRSVLEPPPTAARAASSEPPGTVPAPPREAAPAHRLVAPRTPAVPVPAEMDGSETPGWRRRGPRRYE